MVEAALLCGAGRHYVINQKYREMSLNSHVVIILYFCGTREYDLSYMVFVSLRLT